MKLRELGRGEVGSDGEKRGREFAGRDVVGMADRERGLEGPGAGRDGGGKEGGGKILDLLGH